MLCMLMGCHTWEPLRHLYEILGRCLVLLHPMPRVVCLAWGKCSDVRTFLVLQHHGRLYRALILLGLALFQAPLCLQSSCCYIDINFFCLYPSVYLLVSGAWWGWPLNWLTNHHPSVLWHCLLGHVTRKIVFEMTYNVSSTRVGR